MRALWEQFVTIINQKASGAYYTPDAVADSLLQLGVHCPNDAPRNIVAGVTRTPRPARLPPRDADGPEAEVAIATDSESTETVLRQ